MDVTSEQVGDVVVAAVRADYLDASNHAEIQKAIEALVEPATKLVLDLGNVRFIDSTGLGSIFQCTKAVDAAGGSLKLCGMTERVKVLFDLVRMNKLVDVFGTRQEAIDAFASQ